MAMSLRGLFLVANERALVGVPLDHRMLVGHRADHKAMVDGMTMMVLVSDCADYLAVMGHLDLRDAAYGSAVVGGMVLLIFAVLRERESSQK